MKLALRILLLLLLLPLESPAVTLKIATLSPDGTAWMKAMRAGADEVAKRTDGRVRMRFYPGGVMGNDNAVLRKIRVGQLHGGAITAGGLASIEPDTQIYGLPFFFRSYDEVDYVRQKLDPLIIEKLESRGFVSFGLSEGGFAYLMSNKPLRGIADLAGQKIWVPEGDRIALAAFEAVGVSPIQLPLSDVLTGLQTGLIDTVGNTPVGAIALQWHTRVEYLTDLPLIYTYGGLVIREQALRKLSPADRKTLVEVMKGTFREISARSRRENKSAREALGRQGVRFVEPLAGEMAGWLDAVTATTTQLADDGVYSREMLGLLRTRLQEYRSR